MSTDAPTIGTSTKPSPETFRLLVQYADTMGTKLDLHALAKVTGVSYMVCWKGVDVAKKELATAGIVLGAGTGDGTAAAAATAPSPRGKGKGAGAKGQKRKVVDGEEDEEGGVVKEEPEKKKRAPAGRRAKKVKVEVKEEVKVKEEGKVDEAEEDMSVVTEE